MSPSSQPQRGSRGGGGGRATWGGAAEVRFHLPHCLALSTAPSILAVLWARANVEMSCLDSSLWSRFVCMSKVVGLAVIRLRCFTAILTAVDVFPLRKDKVR
jgi:hypothetical protein